MLLCHFVLLDFLSWIILQSRLVTVSLLSKPLGPVHSSHIYPSFCITIHLELYNAHRNYSIFRGRIIHRGVVLYDDKHSVNLTQLQMLFLLMKIHQFHAHQVGVKWRIKKEIKCVMQGDVKLLLNWWLNWSKIHPQKSSYICNSCCIASKCRVNHNVLTLSIVTVQQQPQNPNNKTTITVDGLRLSNHWEPPPPPTHHKLKTTW